MKKKELTIEDLKCCGNCKYYDYADCFTEKSYYCKKEPEGINSTRDYICINWECEPLILNRKFIGWI